MTTNIFSNFDPTWFNLCYKNSIFIFTLILLMTSTFWYTHSKMVMITTPMTTYINLQLKSTKLPNIKALTLINSSLFTMIILMNMLGMLPYMFSTTSHIIMTISLGLPTWMLLILSSMTFSPKKTIGHLLPDSAPMWLNPFLVLIESTSIIVRPITLSFRLAANMTAGHVVLSLMTSFSISTKMSLFLTIAMMTNLYIMFEVGICLIQSYIFCLLISLYSNDHS